MKSVKQLLRQPLKSILGVALMGLAIAVLVVCLGQYLAAQSTGKVLENTFSSVALPVGKMETEEYLDSYAFSGNVTIPEELEQWIHSLVEKHPEVVSKISEHGILSANIPELTPMNFTAVNHISENITDGNHYFYRFQPNPYGMPYSTAMLVVTLDEVSEPQENIISHTLEEFEIADFESVEDYLNYLDTAERITVTTGYSVKLVGTVQEVVSLQEGFRDPSGLIIRMTITRPTLEALEALEIEVGGTYLVFGMDYYDADWALRGDLADWRRFDRLVLDAFDMSKLHVLTAEEREKYQAFKPNISVAPYAIYAGSHYFWEYDYLQIGAVHLTPRNFDGTISYQLIRDESGKPKEFQPVAEKTILTEDGTEITISAEEYAERYHIPTIAKLDGTVEDFLASEDGASWRDALDMMAVNNQAFAVLGVDKVGYLADFARENSRIVEGREFTVEEQENGSQVCVIHEALAAANGLTVGDTITLNFYQADKNLPYQSHWETTKYGLLNPSASFYFTDTTPFTETTEYTIVGLWRGEELWGDVAQNTYVLSPNTVIVPKTSVETPMEHPESVLFSTIILKNGALDQFRTLAARAGYEDKFICHDQGYSTIAENFHNYDTLGKQVMLVGIAVYTMVLLLVLLFFPGSQGKVLWTMESLGSPRKNRFVHVLAHASVLLVTATVLGGGIGFGVWDVVLDKLQSSVKSTIRLSLEPNALMLILMAQLAVALGVSVLTALFMSRSRSLNKRR